MSRRFGSQRKAPGLLNIGRQRNRKSWTIEKLEDRLVFSIAPVQTISFSNDTAEGAALTLQHELEWAGVQALYANSQSLASGASTDLSADSTATSNPNYVPMSLPLDPLFASQWHLLNTGQEVGVPDLQHLFGVAGQDINVVPAWNMLDDNGNPITGQGVLVGVIDTGVQLFHPDLAANISPTLRYNATNGTSNVAPNLAYFAGSHGTEVSGVIAAVANNGLGGSGVAPGATIVPIKADNGSGFSDQAIQNALRYALEHGVDVTNNSYGPGGRAAIPLTDYGPDGTSIISQLLRQSVIFGRDGLGMVNVFASGNDAGPQFSNGFPSGGAYSSASYNPIANSRYVITVGAVDHDGLYQNADGTFTSYPEAGPNVLVSAPTGSSVPGANSVATDNGYGSGIWTTDLVGDFGSNSAPLPNGFDADFDPLPNPDYTSRFNGTSAATPMVTGVIALMLQANPNLTYRDVQEILVRSSRQTAQFETPSTGGLGQLLPAKNTWQTNQTGPFRNPDSFFSPFFTTYPTGFDTPIADPSTNPVFKFSDGTINFGNYFGFDTNDLNRELSSIYEPQPALFTNGAGYTVSQGYGVFGEQIGFGHGVVDAEAAVYMAKNWHILGQNIDPNTELTYTTAVVPTGSLGLTANLPAAEKSQGPPDGNWFLVPGGIGGDSGFIAYWNEFFKDNPFDNYTGPSDDSRGLSYIDFAVPPSQEMDVEWVEVKVDIGGATSAGMDGLRIMLVSPEGTQSELTNYYPSATWLPYSAQTSSTPANGWAISPGGTYGLTNGSFVWTFSTNRSFGESSSSTVITHPVTGEPVMQEVDTFDQTTGQITTTKQPIFRNWELHIENWSNVPMSFNGVEVVWHGKPIGGGKYDTNYADSGVLSAQRIQGVVGIDTNGDENFNFNRYVQTLNGSHADVSDIRDRDVVRKLDFSDNNHNNIYDEGDVVNQEPFAANVIVDAYRVWNGVPEAAPYARFLTGADGNYYFDLDVQGDLAQTKNINSPHFGQTIEYQIRATDSMSRDLLEDIDTPALTTSDPAFTYLPHYKSTWTINANWFFAPDHDNPLLLGDNPGEVFYDATGNNIASTLVNPSDLPLPGMSSPVPFSDSTTLAHIVPSNVKNLNFLLKQDAPAQHFDVTGSVYADVNGNGAFDGDDASAANVTVYWDKNRNGVYDSGETQAITDANGQYTITVDLTTLAPPVPSGPATYQIGVIRPTLQWQFTDPGQDGVETVYAGPGSADQHVDFFLKPPADAFPGGGTGAGTIQGVVFNDINGDGKRDAGENGAPNFRVFVDANENGVWDSATEQSVLTGSNGSYLLSNVTPGLIRVDIVIPNEGTANAAWAITKPAAGYQTASLGAGGAVTAVSFGLDNLADNDWGDLPDSYGTTAAANGPHHAVTPGFQLGASIDGEVNGVPSAGATGEGAVGDDDNGVSVVSNSGVLVKGTNTLHVAVAGVGGLLTGWMDFNADGHFDESERLQWSLSGNSLGGEADINPGEYNLQITVPQGAVDGPIAARFRWGEQGLSFLGAAAIGEVEDYYFGLNYIQGDYNRNGTVDQADFNVWRKQNGTNVTPYSGADGNGDGLVSQADYDIWRAHFGQSLPAPAAGAGALVAGNSLVGSAAALTGETSVAPAFAAVVLDGGSLQPAPTTSSVVASSAVVLSTRTADPLLLDLALSDLGKGAADSADDSLYESVQHDDSNANDLALAAVLSDDGDWWNAV